ncbi:MAG: KTSC domain-containing protein [Candidatus Coatesbacteria bacterium]|nr:KTSC domain-containing protein [Candidatus Coatesbacteria bacterium]
MLRLPINCRIIATVGYQSGDELLELEFNNGQVYQYEGVSVEVYRAMMGSPKPGDYYREHIRYHFPYRRIR